MRHEFYLRTGNRPPLSNFIVFVDDKMQHDYQYHLVEPAGENFAPDFKPELTPVEMLNMGVFEGKYLNDCRNEFPSFWFENAHLSPEKSDANQNFFHVRSRLPLSEWRRRGWILEPDPRGGFSGTVVTITAAACPKSTRFKSTAGRVFGAIRPKLKKTVISAI